MNGFSETEIYLCLCCILNFNAFCKTPRINPEFFKSKTAAQERECLEHFEHLVGLNVAMSSTNLTEDSFHIFSRDLVRKTNVDNDPL
jgi:hypothetical protein